LKCEHCDKEYHLHCLVATAPDGRKLSTFSYCTGCKEKISFEGKADEDE
jgi:hypothetical protein